MANTVLENIKAKLAYRGASFDPNLSDVEKNALITLVLEMASDLSSLISDFNTLSETVGGHTTAIGLLDQRVTALEPTPTNTETTETPGEGGDTPEVPGEGGEGGNTPVTQGEGGEGGEGGDTPGTSEEQGE